MSEFFDSMISAGDKWRERAISNPAPIDFNCGTCGARFERGTVAFIVQTHAGPRYQCEACRAAREDSKTEERVLG